MKNYKDKLTPKAAKAWTSSKAFLLQSEKIIAWPRCLIKDINKNSMDLPLCIMVQLSFAMFYSIKTTINSLQHFENMTKVSGTNLLQREGLLPLHKKKKATSNTWPKFLLTLDGYLNLMKICIIAWKAITSSNYREQTCRFQHYPIKTSRRRIPMTFFWGSICLKRRRGKIKQKFLENNINIRTTPAHFAHWFPKRSMPISEASFW